LCSAGPLVDQLGENSAAQRVSDLVSRMVARTAVHWVDWMALPWAASSVQQLAARRVSQKAVSRAAHSAEKTVVWLVATWDDGRAARSVAEMAGP
jgi:hypothetical protein